jgi:hypothetical protein
MASTAPSSIWEFHENLGFQMTEKIEPIESRGVERRVAVTNHREKPVQSHAIELRIILPVRGDETRTTVAITISKLCQDAVENSLEENSRPILAGFSTEWVSLSKISHVDRDNRMQ